MSAVLSWGLEFVRLTQRAASPALTAVMRGASFLGTQWFYLAAMAFVYWCWDKRRAARLGIAVLLSAFVNLWLKDIFAQPRPYDLDPAVGFGHEPSYGLPSGHAQVSLTFWGIAAPLFRKPWNFATAIALPLLIGFSRIYLGLHFPTDVLAGWALGAVAVLIEGRFGDDIASGLRRLRPSLLLAMAALVALAMNAAIPSETSISGAFFGLAIGLIYAPKAAPFSEKGSWPRRLARLGLGLATTALVYAAPKALLRTWEPDALLRFIRYAALGCWISLGAPLLFLATGLAGREAPVDEKP